MAGAGFTQIGFEDKAVCCGVVVTGRKALYHLNPLAVAAA